MLAPIMANSAPGTETEQQEEDRILHASPMGFVGGW